MFLIVFFFQLKLARVWSEIGVFGQFDVIFDSDPNLWIHMFAHGWGANNLLHPFCNYVFTIPIRIIEAVASTLGIVDDPVMYREALVIYISPISSALMAIFIYFTFRRLEFNHIKAGLVSILCILGFSSLTFGSIPSVYTLTSASNALLLLLALNYSMRPSKLTHILFIAVGMFTVGITSSNIIHVGWLYWFMYSSEGMTPIKALFKSIKTSSAVLLAVVAIFYAVDFVVQRGDTVSIFNTSRYIATFTPTPAEQAIKLARFPEVVARTIIPTFPVEMPSFPGSEFGAPIKVQVSISEIEFGFPAVILSIIAIIAVGGGTVIAIKKGGLWRHMAYASLATIFTFGVLHSLFGQYIYLYSQTWHVPTIFLLAAWLNTSFFSSRKGYILIAVAFVLLLIGDIYVINDITNTVTPTVPTVPSI